VQDVYFHPYGGIRWSQSGGNAISPTSSTRRTYTGQYDIGFWAGAIQHYNARQYDYVLGRFLQPDTIVPNPGNPYDLNRYMYGLSNPLKYIDPSGHVQLCAQSCEEEADKGWHPSAPSLPMLYSGGGFDAQATWGQITDVYDLLARAIMTEEGSKILGEFAEDALGAGWIIWNHAIERTKGLRDPNRNDVLEYLMQPNHPIAGVWSHNLTRAALDPGNHPTYFGAGDPDAGNKAYAIALSMAHSIVDGTGEDVIQGRLYYADALANGEQRDRTAFWRVWGSPYDSPTDPHLTIPRIRQLSGPMHEPIWGGRK
jgi:RHS repeat-associated protein